MLSSKNTVPLPESGIIIRRNGKYKYVYKVLKTFRNDKGQPTNTRKLIGRLDLEGKRLVPNDNYYALYDSSTATEFVSVVESVVSIGAPFLIAHILSRLGATRILEDVLGCSRARSVITAAGYMSCVGNVFEHVSGWCERSMISGSTLTPQKASVLFASLTHDEKMAFFKSWVNINAKQGYISYDVTSFSSYAEGIRDLEWGYNRDGDRLPQLNLGCYLAQESRLPIFYVTYPGSIVDKSHLPYMMAYNKELGIGRDIVFVMDRGFCSTSNVNFMHLEGLRYVMGVDTRHKSTRAAIDSEREKIISLRNTVGDDTYAVAVRSRFYGESSVIHIYNSPELGERQRRDLFRTVENMETELVQLESVSEKGLKRFARFFNIEIANGKLSFTRNYDRIDAASQNCGIFCILTNTALTSTEVLSIYRRKGSIEKGFDDIKNHIDIKRMRAHTDATVGGKLFCSFIALIVASEMTNCLYEFNSASRQRILSKRGLIAELEKIRIFVTPDGRRLMNPLTKTQRDLLKAFKANDHDLNTYISNESLY
jgi:transposase